jgi:3'(2'), 5'-bisphosphate nucleotidase
MIDPAESEFPAARLSCESDPELARLLATHAGVILLRLRGTLRGVPADRIRAEGDRRAHEFLTAALRRLRPGDAVLSDAVLSGGALGDPGRLDSDRVWIIDPLDGTREYGERGRSDWAVHIALVEAGHVTAGAVSLPAQEAIFATDVPPVVPPVGDRRLRVVTSRSRLPHLSYSVAEALDADLLPMGSAGAKAMTVVRGDADVYAHAGGMYEWDSAAPVAVAAAAGLHVSRMDGSPLRYNRADPWLPDVLICRVELAETCLAAARDSWW